MGIVANIRAAPWYPQMAATMQAAGVPEYLWMSIIASEDSSLNTGAMVADHYTSDGSFAGYSYGLFQLNNNPRGVDPAYAGQWAAAKLSPALAAAGNYTPDQALTIAEQTAWPGMANPPDDAARRANLQLVTAELGMKYQANGTTSTPAPGVPSVSTPSLLQQIQSIPDNVNSTINSWVPQIETNLLIGGIVLAMIAGGFALLAATE